MQKKTIKKAVESKMLDWLGSITDEVLQKDVKENLLVSGGSIASMFLNEPVNDYDVYIKDLDVLSRLTKYYTKNYEPLEVLLGKHRDDLLSGLRPNENNKRKNAILALKEDQVKIYMYDGSGFRVPAIPVNGGENLAEKKYTPKFFSPNAISLSDDIQIVCRFHGDAKKIHETFDFIHATNYFTFEEGLVTNLEAMESLVTKQLKYQGSLYPLTSIIRTKKFIKRHWNIGAGEYLKIMFQISKLDLTDPVVLDDQLIGVDVAYFSKLIEILQAKHDKDPNFTLTYGYLCTLIDKVFDGSEELGSQD